MILSKALRAAAGNIAPAPPSTDPQFNYVSMLLHGDGTNGAQNNTFVDSSTNNFTITRNGNTTQGSLSPYGNLWSNYFDGNGDYLTASNNAAFDFGSGNFTVEGWIYITANAALDPDSVRSTNICACMFDNSPTSGWHFSVTGNSATTGTGLVFDVWNSGSRTSFSATSTIPQNTWNHVAVVRNGSSLSIYLNGTSILSTTISVSVNSGGNGFDIGSLQQGTAPKYYWYFPGYISNLRIVKGTAVYTSAFTPPTAPLTAISGTSLLTCQSNRFVDNSANNFTITRSGDVRVTKEAPFLPTAAYSTSVIGGSGYFDGTGDYLSTSSVTFAGDFTVEGWVYINNLSSNRIMVQIGDDSTATGPAFYVTSTGKFNVYASSTIISGVANIITNTWYHLAVCRSGSTVKSYVNGVLDVTTTNTTTFTGLVRVGAEWFGGAVVSSSMMNGYISNLRLVAGTAVYTTNFTPPTAPVTAISGTSLLLNFTNAGIFDNAAENDMETVGNAQISTSVKKYGTGSLAFDGSGDRILVPGNQNLKLGSGNFTIEMWLYVNATSDMQIINTGGSANYSYAIYKAGTNLGFYLSSNGTSWNLVSGNTFGTVNTGTWYHVALVRNGSTVTPYLNGVAGTSATVTAALADFAVLGIGDSTQSTPGASTLNGYIDDLRITKGVARYTANFTPPTAAFPDQ